MAFAGILVVNLLFLIPFIVGLIIGIVRKDRFAWILMLCLIVVVIISTILPPFLPLPTAGYNGADSSPPVSI